MEVLGRKEGRGENRRWWDLAEKMEIEGRGCGGGRQGMSREAEGEWDG